MDKYIRKSDYLQAILIYQGEKPQGVGSVRSMAITDDYFVIAGRPVGSSWQGGEENNKLIVIDRDDLSDVTASFLDSNETFELGHANGIVYDDSRNRYYLRNGGCYYVLDGVAYVLFNGGGMKNGSYFIYRAQFASSDLEREDMSPT